MGYTLHTCLLDGQHGVVICLMDSMVLLDGQHGVHTAHLFGGLEHLPAKSACCTCACHAPAMQDVTWARSLDGTEYMPGLVGLNNMKRHDYANVIVQILARIPAIRYQGGRGGGGRMLRRCTNAGGAAQMQELCATAGGKG